MSLNDEHLDGLQTDRPKQLMEPFMYEPEMSPASPFHGLDYKGFDSDVSIRKKKSTIHSLTRESSLKGHESMPDKGIYDWLTMVWGNFTMAWGNFRYDRSHLLPDILAGLSTGIMSLPQGLAYASLARLPPIYGLIPSFIPALIYAILGPCHQSSVGAEALKSELVGMALAHFPDAEHPEVAAVLALMFGSMLLLMGLLRMGWIESVLSQAVTQGFVLAVALTIIVEQLPSMLGFKCPECEGSGASKFITILSKVKERANQTAIIITVISLIFLFLMPRLKKRLRRRFPWVIYVSEILILVSTSIIVSYAIRLDHKGVRILGEVAPITVARVPLVTFDRLKALFPNAAIIAVISYTESIVVLKMYSRKHKYKASANNELVALGLANAVGAFFGSFGAQGSLPRSQVMDATGAKSNVALFTAGTLVGLSIYFALPLFKYLPFPVMGSIVFMAAASLMEFHSVKFFWTLRKYVDLALWAGVAITTLCVSIEFGIGLGVVSSLLIIVKTTSFPSVRVLEELEDPTSNGDNDNFVGRGYADAQNCDTRPIQGVLIVKLEGQIFFANISRLEGLLELVKGEHRETHSYIMDMSSLQLIDASALIALKDLIEHRILVLKLRLAFVCHAEVKTDLERSGITALLGDDNIFASLDKAVEAVRDPSEPWKLARSQSHTNNYDH